MELCEGYNPDNVFNKLKIVEFPASFVGLSFTQDLDVEIDLHTCAYLKTMHDGSLLKFQDAREISASHRAFDITPVNNNTISIKYHPKNESISRMKRKKFFENRFVFDLRLIQVEGTHCCANELHAEIGRFYISGQFEYCIITHYPEIIDFGDVNIHTTKKQYLRIRNESTLIAAKLQCVRVTGFEVMPQTFTILPNSSRQLIISIKPTCLKIAQTLLFRIKNPHDVHQASETDTDDENYLNHIIKCKSNIIMNYEKPVDIQVQSLHTLQEPDRKYTYMGKEIEIHMKRKAIAVGHLQICKSFCPKKAIIEKFISLKDKCCLELPQSKTKPGDFCKIIREKASVYDVFDIMFLPFVIDFGRVGLFTYGEQELIIKNCTKFGISINLKKDDCVLYTEDKLANIALKLKSLEEIKVAIFCWGFVEGNYRGTFEYVIDDKFYLKHPYHLQVGNPTLMIEDKILKFGMVTNETFITSVPVRIYNNFNVSVDFEWEEPYSDTPFEIIPKFGSIPKHSCKVCDVIYIYGPTKTKTYEIDFVSKFKLHKVVPIEVSVITRKLSIKFKKPAVVFKDIPLNIEIAETVKMENSSREIVFFHVVEPLIPGIKIRPMSGTIRPKTIINLEIIVQISCVLEFSFDVYVKINNKENIVLPISGNVVDPKITINPKNINMARIPSYMVTYVPVTFQNLSSLRTEVKVLDTGDEDIFDVYIANGHEKQRVLDFYLEGGQSKTVYIKVCDVIRREYDMYIPFKINDLLGPPNQDSGSTELKYYTKKYEKFYENNSKVKIKSVNKDISSCRITGIITIPWIKLSIDKFEIDYMPQTDNTLVFTMTNVSKNILFITIVISKLLPNFTLDLLTESIQSVINENNIKFELESNEEVSFSLKFHPKSHGNFISTALLYLDKLMTIPYYDLTFIGKRQAPAIIPSTYKLIFPPCYVDTDISRKITLKIDVSSHMDSFTYVSKEEPNLTVNFVDYSVIQDSEKYHTIVTVEIKASCHEVYARIITLGFLHECGSGCDVEVNFCFTYCPITLYTSSLLSPIENPYPYYPLPTQTDFYEYMETCSSFLGNWMHLQGFCRELYPAIPDTFHAISSEMSSPANETKSKRTNVSYLNFVRRIAGPLFKDVHEVTGDGLDKIYKCVKEIHDTYKQIINLLRARGPNLWVLQAKFLLSHDQFVIYTKKTAPKSNGDMIFNQELQNNILLFNRLNKQSWIDFILQSYKVFVLDSCFFECVCDSLEPRDNVKVLIDWYNEHIMLQYNKLIKKDRPIKVITNITTDLSDGIAIASSILSYCPFMAKHFSIFCEVFDDSKEGDTINNACLIIEAMNILRLNFPLSSKDFLNPNFIQMLFLSIHLYVTLPMFMPKDTIKFNPPLLRSSSRLVAINPTDEESLIFNYTIINNNNNSFIVEKAPSSDNGKKIFVKIKYIANFVNKESCVLLVHGYSKTRIFDTYIVFLLYGCVGFLNPVRKCKVTGPLYRPNKVDVLVSSPFITPATFTISLTDSEPTIPVNFEGANKPKFYLRRLCLIDKELTLSGLPKKSGQDVQEHKLRLKLICLSTQIGYTWIWFRSDVGEFFIRVTTQPRWDLPIDTLEARVHTWPMDPCSCGEACECYRTTVLMIPHRNDLMIKSLRYALLEHASEIMMQIFDQLIETPTGKIILTMLLRDSGTNMSEISHIFDSEITFRISSRSVVPRINQVTLAQHSSAVLGLPVTVPANEKAEKFSVTFTSDCGLDIRTYRILFIEDNEG